MRKKELLNIWQEHAVPMGWGYFFHLYNFLNPTLLTSSRKNTWKLFWTHKPSPLRQSLLCHSSPQVISLIYLGNLLEKQTNILSFWCFFRDNRLMSRSDYSPMFPWVYILKKFPNLLANDLRLSSFLVAVALLKSVSVTCVFQGLLQNVPEHSESLFF